MGYYNGYGPMFGGGWGMNGFGFIFMLLGLVILIALIVGLLRWLAGSGIHHSNPTVNSQITRQARLDEALHILEKRFAHGEIDEDEFVKRRQILKDGR